MRSNHYQKIFVIFALAVLLLAAVACDAPEAQTDQPTALPDKTTLTAPTAANTPPEANAGGTQLPGVTPANLPDITPSNPPGVNQTNSPDINPTNPPQPGATNPPGSTTTLTPGATRTALPTSANPTLSLPSSTPPAPGGKLHVVSTATYQDSSGNFHVVGEIQNGDTRILTNMELTIVIKDASGNSLLKDNNDRVVGSLTFNPMLTNLAPGEFSPFDYYLDASAGTPDEKSVLVTVTDQSTSDITRADFEIRHAQLKAGGPDSYFVTGEIANKTDNPIAINKLAVALVDKNNKVISADYSVDYTVYLQAAGDPDKRDVTPFYLAINNPGVDPADWKTYVDAEVVDQPDNYPVAIKITNNYFDDAGSYHIVGAITNNSSDTLTTQIVAGLYDKNGVVLDAYSSFSPVNAAPKEVIPYDISAFTNVNSNPDEAARVDTFTVQIDDYFTFPSSIETVDLQSTGESIDKVDNQWTVRGQAVNNSKKALSSENVMVSVYDKDGKLVAVNFNWVMSSSDSIAAGEANPYSVVVVLDPNANTTGYTYKVSVRGDVK